MNKTIYLLLFCLTSCLSFKKNNEYANDFKMMGKKDFSKKYFSLYAEHKNELSNLEKDKAYYILRNGQTFQIVLFSDDNFIYVSPLMPYSMFESAFLPIKLGRSSYFRVRDNLIKIESMAVTPGNVFSVIQEGKVTRDTIFMNKEYNAKGIFKNNHKIFEDYILISDVIVYKIKDEYFIERKKKK